MMETSEIIARANEAVQEIYGKMGHIESCEAALKALDGADVFIGRGKDELLDLHSALDDDRIADIMAYIHTVVKNCMDTETAELNAMCSKPTVITVPSDVTPNMDNKCAPEQETLSEAGDTDKAANELTDNEAAAHEVTVATQEVKGPKASKSTLPPDEEEKLLRRLYVTEGKTVKEIADIMGLTKANIYDRIKKYGLRNKRYDREWDGFDSESARRN